MSIFVKQTTVRVVGIGYNFGHLTIPTPSPGQVEVVVENWNEVLSPNKLNKWNFYLSYYLIFIQVMWLAFNDKISRKTRRSHCTYNINTWFRSQQSDHFQMNLTDMLHRSMKLSSLWYYRVALMIFFICRFPKNNISYNKDLIHRVPCMLLKFSQKNIASLQTQD